ncbi:hypothetical protein PIB30_009456 [Stylosanthes scabra]|uniref:Uncharacterized protein n=1 Tax=Stylosanthes scabra TaxID=79078 RepID=A0ABU6X6W9_9FABA|nr:hypothetical protein [Stylosanthes scabra]
MAVIAPGGDHGSYGCSWIGSDPQIRGNKSNPINNCGSNPIRKKSNPLISPPPILPLLAMPSPLALPSSSLSDSLMASPPSTSSTISSLRRCLQRVSPRRNAVFLVALLTAAPSRLSSCCSSSPCRHCSSHHDTSTPLWLYYEPCFFLRFASSCCYVAIRSDLNLKVRILYPIRFDEGSADRIEILAIFDPIQSLCIPFGSGHILMGDAN